MEKCPQTKKEIHRSKGVADAHLRHLQEMRDYVGHVYHCKFCSGWHVGRQKKNAHRNKYARE